MAISIDWPSKVITVPKADTELVSSGPPEIRKYNVNTFRLALKNLEDNEQGITFVRTHKHNTEVTLSGLTFARTMEIINGYTITFEDGSYAVRLYGANHNILDVANYNSVQLVSSNSAGLTTSGAITTEDKTDIINGVWDELMENHSAAGSFADYIMNVTKILGYDATKDGYIITIWEDISHTTVWRQYNLADKGRVLVS